MQMNEKAPYILKKLLEDKGWLELPAEGTSMYPLIAQGDICQFVACNAVSLKKGDIILFHTSNGDLVAHRFLRFQYSNGEAYYIFKGDTNLAPDEPVPASRIIGKLAVVDKGAVRIRTDQLYSCCWSRLLFSFPLLSSILRSYLDKKHSRAM